MTAIMDVTFHQYVGLAAERAYAQLCDWHDHGRWVPFTRVVVHDPDSFTAYSGIGPFALADNMRVVERDDLARSVIIEKTGPLLTGTAAFAVRPFAGGCVVTWHEHLRVPLLPGCVAPLLRSTTVRMLRRGLRRLAR